MTIQDIVCSVEGRKVGFVNRFSCKYAQSLLAEEENVKVAVLANIRTKRDSFPGVVAITNTRVMAVCGIPGIKRQICFPIEHLEPCTETSSFFQYQVVFQTRKDAFHMTIDPDLGEDFSKYVAWINGEEYEEISLQTKGLLLNPKLLRRQQRNKLRRSQEEQRAIEKDIEIQKATQEKFQKAEMSTPQSKDL
ncbi:MAG: hypothetical protein ACRCW1_04600 [Anaerotignaceae bacterium]